MKTAILFLLALSLTGCKACDMFGKMAHSIINPASPLSEQETAHLNKALDDATKDPALCYAHNPLSTVTLEPIIDRLDEGVVVVNFVDARWNGWAFVVRNIRRVSSVDKDVIIREISLQTEQPESVVRQKYTF